ncbi:hypothetical protein KGF54_001238 [Candida jiufengensis]|uniref:uncharacterized protein n=1 Tax=Candida jiufengensis TaxID=497108 RepID=UPI0022251A42|nr:uncharacterized protein KGF54_001238 [Candida jiufengensis]KAI5955736.1 hypothetical protein KGF54_001238 [Candida jiufengensis]
MSTSSISTTPNTSQGPSGQRQEESTVKVNLSNLNDPILNFLHQPTPTKPNSSSKNDLIDNQNGKDKAKSQSQSQSLSQSQSQSSSTSQLSKDKKLPSLVVKQDHNLKSCLSQSSPNGEHTNNIPSIDHQFNSNQHPQFISNDNIAPNKHGLISGEDYASVGHSNFTPIISSQGSISSSVTSPQQSARNPTSPPISSPLIGLNHQSPPISQQQSQQNQNQPQTQPQPHPPVSRMNSLRYSKIDDKKFIETTRQLSNNNSEEKLQSLDDSLTPTDDNKLHLLIGISGCVSIHKNIFLIIEKLFELYTHDNLEIQVVLTKSAEYILSEKLHRLNEMGVKVWFSDDGEKYFLTSPFQKVYSKAVATGNKKLITPQIMQQYSLAYDLQRWTDVLLLAPLSANTMAKLINGLADNLLTDILHVWPIPLIHHISDSINSPPQQISSGAASIAGSVSASVTNSASNSGTEKKDTTIISNNLIAPKPIVAALALTNSMYSHPITKKQLGLLQETYPNMSILKPVEKCVDMDGNIAMGGMRSWREVVDFVSKKLGPPPPDDEEEQYNEDNEDDDEEDEDEEEEEEVEVVETSTKPEIKQSSKDQTSAVLEKSPKRIKSPSLSQPKKLEVHNEGEKISSIISNEPTVNNELNDQINSTSSLSSTTKSYPLSSTNKQQQQDKDNCCTRRRGNTITKKELAEHEKLASQNAILNSGIGVIHEA